MRPLILTLILLAACTGDPGLTGPTGPQGPAGPPAEPRTLTMTLGGAGQTIELPLPPYVPVSPPPSVTCWYAGVTFADLPPDPGTVWTSAVCEKVHDGTRWIVSVTGPPVEPDAETLGVWTARAVVVY